MPDPSVLSTVVTVLAIDSELFARVGARPETALIDLFNRRRERPAIRDSHKLCQMHPTHQKELTRLG